MTRRASAWSCLRPLAGASCWYRVDYRPDDAKRFGLPKRRGRLGPRLGGPLNSPAELVGRRFPLFGRRAE